MIHQLSFNEIRIWISLLIIEINLSSIVSVSSELVSIQKQDPNKLDKDSYTYFNSLYAFRVDEESLNRDFNCSGRCDLLDDEFVYNYGSICDGIVHECWLIQHSAKRLDAVNNYKQVRRRNIGVLNDPIGGDPFYVNAARKNLEEARWLVDHTGSDCGCLCERKSNSYYNIHGPLLDSICFDHVEVDNGYVVTGVRFKRYENRIHLELQQGILANGRIDAGTVAWKKTSECNNSKPVVYNFRGSSYKGLNFVLEDMILPRKQVVIGVTVGEKLLGQYVTDDGNLDTMKIIDHTQCYGSSRTRNLVHGYSRLLPPTNFLGMHIPCSTSCKHHLLFGGTSYDSDFIQHIVPYIDLQEIVTDPPEPIRGIGWYYRGYPESGGFLALRIWK
ncbi:uncharacterized protein LOC103572994 [Microplitis demolitor]|uniref:uncharacterized protein LOC103572994 n=1 Tax=Microplitis demolitor TaxID=69319 RepID=UPI00235B6A03|nr:uncharacterized protein LOC103572994 [Microplitis demolitor]